MDLKSPDQRPPQPKENPLELGRKKATAAWVNLSTGLQSRSITPDSFLGETRTLVDHLYTLSPKEKKHVEKSFRDLRNHAKKFIEEVKPVLIGQINSHTGKTDREQDVRVAELLGLAGGRFGLNVDTEVSKALGPESPVARKRLLTGVAALTTAGMAAYYGPDSVRTFSTAARIAKGLSYVAQASLSDSELKAPQPIPAKPAASPTLQPRTPSPSPASSPSPAASPEIISSPTATLEPTKPPTPTNTPEPEPTAVPTPDIAKEKMVEIGDKNLAEFFLGAWIQELKGKGNTLWENNPSYRERVPKKNAESDNITIVYLGTDNERSRDKHATMAARSDVVMIEIFNPHTFQTTSISLNRDLLVPEAVEHGLDRINTLTTISETKGLNPHALIQRMLETATGLRIDGIVETNIDFVNGYDEYYDVVLKQNMDGKNSIIDRFIPEGIEVNPPAAIDDPLYPKGFGVQHVHFDKGPQVLHGQDLVKYARARKGAGNNDYMRSQRQREVAFKVFRGLASKLVDDLEQGRTDTLDLTVDVLKEQQDAGNYFQYDIDIIDMMQGINGSIKQILEMPNGNKIIAKLAANSMGNVARLLGAEASKRYGVPFGDPENGFTSYGLSNEDGSLEDHPNAAGAAITRLRGSGPHITRKSSEGNYMAYWEPLRKKVDELISK